ncbi:MAG: Mor transcription activator family protein [Vibrio sp.]|uniref:Mor transcription activator family protein n=1 Tax=Vibrio sp. TaxID=678 RepID=UPI003A8925A4
MKSKLSMQSLAKNKHLEPQHSKESIKWPEEVREMYGLIKATLKDSGVDEKIATPLIINICEHFGGNQLYLGRADALKRHLRDIQIVEDFSENDISYLVKKYKLCRAQIYRIIRNAKYNK